MKYLDTKTCVPTAFCKLVLQKQHTGLGVCRLRHCSWLVECFGVWLFGCLAGWLVGLLAGGWLAGGWLLVG